MRNATTASSERSILDKILKFKPLKDWDITINYGIKTGFNEAFIIDEATKERLIKEDSKSAEIIKPLLRGRDIKRYSYDFNNLYLINVHNGLKHENIEPINVDNYPAVKKHLDKYNKQLEQRADKGDTFYNLRNCAYLEDFRKEKIIWKEMGNSPAFIYDKESYYTNDTCRIMVGNHLIFLLSIFNSKCWDFIFKKFYSGGGLGNDGFRYKSEFMLDTPIPEPYEDTENKLVNLVDDIIQLQKNNKDSSDIEAEVDKIVYSLYNLTDEEIRVIEGE